MKNLKIVKPPRFVEGLFPSYTWRFFHTEPIVYLTFDDGPNPEITPFVLDQLAEFDMKATFFCVGANVKKHPELAERIIAEGHAIGNHTFNHCKGTTTSTANYLDSVEAFNQLHPTTLFRPPYGRMKWTQRNALKKNYRIIMWSWLSYDFDKSVAIEKILKQANRIKKGDILVLHDNPKIMERQRELLPKLLAMLREKGLVSKAIEY